MTVESDIIAVLEERAPRLPIDIAGALPSRNKGSVMTTIALMVKQRRLTKGPDGRVDIPKGDSDVPVTVEAPKPWRAARLAPFQRVTLYLEAVGPKSKYAVMAMLTDTGVPSPKNVLNDMMREGTIHPDDQELLRLGPNPRAPANPSSGSRTWHQNVPPRDLPKKPHTPSEAKRTPEASGTSKKPEAAAAPTPVADEHDEGAQALESPASGIGPAPASAPPASSENRADIREQARALLDDTHALDQEPAMPQKEPSAPPSTARPAAPPAPPAPPAALRPGAVVDVPAAQADVHTILAEAFVRCQRDHGVVLTAVRFDALDVSTAARTEYLQQRITVDSIAVRSRRGEA